uniref:Uncharacterized protein n=1 Tax=Oryza punctata TaxID=4537 RepID=A0A0E0JWP2_ORYPU
MWAIVELDPRVSDSKANCMKSKGMEGKGCDASHTTGHVAEVEWGQVTWGMFGGTQPMRWGPLVGDRGEGVRRMGCVCGRLTESGMQ